jgi:hypothetical protein
MLADRLVHLAAIMLDYHIVKGFPI